MSNAEWHQDQAAGEQALRELDRQRKEDEGKAALADELRELLSSFIDEKVLGRGFSVTDAEWERACLLCGRWCPPFVKFRISEKKGG